MTQEDKELLLKDLYSRLPYGLKCSIYRVDDFGVRWRDATLNGVVLDNYGYEFYFDDYVCVDSINKIKPYLFPLSSMTEEQKREYEDALTYHDYVKGGWTIAKSFDDEYIIPYWFIDFCNKNHLDYRGLIEKGLAIDATNLNIY